MPLIHEGDIMPKRYLKLVLALFFVLITACEKSEPPTEESNQNPPPKTDPDTPIAITEIPKPPTVQYPDRLKFFEDRKNVVLMVSIDGFRHDYLNKIKLPTLESLAKTGVTTEGLVPSFPTLTFPNHVTLITGRAPGRHGIVSNFFYDQNRKEHYAMNDGKAVDDGSWYRGEPIWTVLEQVGIKTATCFWVGSEAKINGIDPTYLLPYDGNLTNEGRANQVIEWLSLSDQKRPQYINLYFSDVDSKGHSYGPDSPQVETAAKEIDAAIEKVVNEAKKLEINLQIIVVSDHGMNTIETQRIALYDLVDLSDVITTERGATTQIYSNDVKKTDELFNQLTAKRKNFSVYKKGGLPTNWKFDDPNRTGDIVVVADFPYYIDTAKSFLPMNDDIQKQLGRSTHGWDPANKNMQGFFLAHGSLFKSGIKILEFENVHVYPMVLDLFGVKQSMSIDGRSEILSGIRR